MERRKEQMIASLWANPNYDDDKGTRGNALEEIESQYEAALAGVFDETPEEDIDENNPFYMQGKKGVERIMQPREEDGSVGEVIQAEFTQYKTDQS